MSYQRNGYQRNDNLDEDVEMANTEASRILQDSESSEKTIPAIQNFLRRFPASNRNNKAYNNILDALVEVSNKDGIFKTQEGHALVQVTRKVRIAISQLSSNNNETLESLVNIYHNLTFEIYNSKGVIIPKQDMLEIRQALEDPLNTPRDLSRDVLETIESGLYFLSMNAMKVKGQENLFHEYPKYFEHLKTIISAPNTNFVILNNMERSLSQIVNKWDWEETPTPFLLETTKTLHDLFFHPLLETKSKRLGTPFFSSLVALTGRHEISKEQVEEILNDLENLHNFEEVQKKELKVNRASIHCLNNLTFHSFYPIESLVEHLQRLPYAKLTHEERTLYIQTMYNIIFHNSHSVLPARVEGLFTLLRNDRSIIERADFEDLSTNARILTNIFKCESISSTTANECMLMAKTLFNALHKAEKAGQVKPTHLPQVQSCMTILRESGILTPPAFGAI